MVGGGVGCRVCFHLFRKLRLQGKLVLNANNQKVYLAPYQREGLFAFAAELLDCFLSFAPKEIGFLCYFFLFEGDQRMLRLFDSPLSLCKSYNGFQTGQAFSGKSPSLPSLTFQRCHFLSWPFLEMCFQNFNE